MQMRSACADEVRLVYEGVELSTKFICCVIYADEDSMELSTIFICYATCADEWSGCMSEFHLHLHKLPDKQLLH